MQGLGGHVVFCNVGSWMNLSLWRALKEKNKSGAEGKKKQSKEINSKID